MSARTTGLEACTVLHDLPGHGLVGSRGKATPPTIPFLARLVQGWRLATTVIDRRIKSGNFPILAASGCGPLGHLTEMPVGFILSLGRRKVIRIWVAHSDSSYITYRAFNILSDSYTFYCMSWVE